MRTKKIRGLKRRLKSIEKWRLEYCSMNIIDILQRNDSFYAKIRVDPWSRLSLVNSKIPEPKGKIKQTIFQGLLDIYEYWKVQLESLGQPYYLKIWLFEPRFSQSQVVCAINNCITYYETNFFNPTESKKMNTNHYKTLQSRIDTLHWEYFWDEDYYDNTDVGKPQDYSSIKDYEESKTWFKQLLQMPHRTNIFNEPIGDIVESYLFKRGDLWIGG